MPVLTGAEEINKVTALLEKLILPTIRDQVFRHNVLLTYFRRPNS
jgi:hypothetical protein